MTTSSSPHLVDALARLARRHPVGRKLVISQTFGGGRELLRRLSLEGLGWIGFEVVTIAPLALRLAREGMERASLRAMDPFDERALLDESLDAALLAEGKGLGELGEGVGFRERVHSVVTALRLSGIGPKELERAWLADWSKRLFLLRVLQRYERLLGQRRLADTASVLRLALASLEDDGHRIPDTLDAEIVVIVPGVSTRGLSGQLLAALQARGAKVLETDPVVGLAVPDSVLWNRHSEGSAYSYLFAPEQLASDSPPSALELFHAASVTDELREVIRRVAERGLAWDQVEIVTPDPAAYGSALHALSAQLGIPVTYAVGLPVERTRPGRVVRAYLDWIEGGFQSSPIRRLLEAGDLRPGRTRLYHAPAELARRFRGLRIGWGRKRYRSQIRVALAGLEESTARTWEDAESFERRRTQMAGELKALRSILFPTLKATPAIPDRMGEGGAPVSPAEIARGLRAFLRRVPRGGGADRSARERINHVLERVEATLRRRTDFRAAATVLRRHLEIRVRAPGSGVDVDDPGAPWSSEGGHLHLSDMEHGGYTGRPAVFVVGADAEHLPGAGMQDPVLLDSDRRVLGKGLPTSSELLRERIFRFAAFFARLRGAGVTLSYRAWDAAEARSIGPSPVLLAALRLQKRDPHLTFRDLYDELGRVVCRVPRAGRLALDTDDVWMSGLGSGRVMRDGVGQVRAAFPKLDAGLSLLLERSDGVPGPAHGVIEARQDLDPRKNPSLVVSASRLEDLGACPLRYLHRSVMRVYPPDDPELDPDRWLNPLSRGGLLHEVFETSLREARARKLKMEEPGFEALAVNTLGSCVERLRAEVPVPGEGALRRELVALEEDVRSFVRMVRQHGAPWVALELAFGIGDDEPVVLDLEQGQLRLRGAIDRVDENLQGVHVVDYKTGVPQGLEGGSGAFDGGRRLQHALYAHAAEQRLGGTVVSGEYHYPTRRGENQAFVYDRLRLAGVGALLDLMLDTVASGSFVPTERADDCRFCDYAEVCRTRQARFGKVVSPLAEWSEQHLNTGLSPAFEQLKRVRTFED
jgi:CRISPR/Cas system-associated exonuclease Cas4 (RecB family)